ncbi:hypothetical protein [Leifsonia sp. fls2-241-R2A-40a]|uniref:hypothetical protein n=1 Tax=Leifsonia sp. fls2-241-R2A-40a TaxID=3040290 RepID=UPI002550EC8A|nr:hypothetical protein [Leifsonia sp. fls2-241-R2A-40a]
MRRDRGRAALVRGFRDAYLADDAWTLARLLGGGVCVVVDTGAGCEEQGRPGERAGGPPASVPGIAAALTLLRRTLGDPASLRLELRAVNGGPGLLAFRAGRAVAVVALSGRPGAVDHVWVVANPAKLTEWS